MIEIQPSYKHHFRERRAMLDTALKLIAEGRYQNSAIREIAFHARLAESTALHFYPNSNLLLQELELHIVQEVNEVIASGIKSSRFKKEKFLNTWLSLYQFNLKNQGLFKFIDQSTLILKDPVRIENFHTALNGQLITFFETLKKSSFTARQSASIFQMNVASAVKIITEQKLDLSPKNIHALALSCWITLAKAADQAS